MTAVWTLGLAAALCFSAQAGEVAAGDPVASLGELSLEQLVDLQITSVSKRETALASSPAAVAVLTQEDIRRLGATSIPEALRAVPGVDVAQIRANAWAVSVRGFNDEYANKLLVLMDGRSIYTPTFGGVFWNLQDVVLEDLDRIEVVRGPGATLWGANAVNGVINIITKSARETQGALVSSSYGTLDQPSVTARYGGKLATNLFYRVYVKYFNRDSFEDNTGRDEGDDWSMTRGGLRLDWEAGNNTITVSGDYFDGHYGEQVGKTSLFPASYQVFSVEAPASGGNILGRWSHPFTEESEMRVQVYYDHYDQDEPFGGGVLVAAPNEFDPGQNYISERRDTWDIDAQHNFVLGDRQAVVWGLGYRHTQDKMSSGGTEIFFQPEEGHDDIFSAFVQDEVTIVPERWQFTIGTKVEHDNVNGWEAEPSGRLLWTPTEHQTYWASVARAVRTPTRLERDSRINLLTFNVPVGPLTNGMASALGNPDAESEELLAYELGCRFEPTRKLSFDVAAFYNDYSLLVAQSMSPGFEFSPAPPHLLQAYASVNDVHGRSYGTELLTHWQVTGQWRLTAGYTWLRTEFASRPSIALSSPEHQVNLRSTLQLGRQWEINGALYYVDQVQSVPQGTAEMTIPAYVRADLGVTWKPGRNLEISVWGQNLQAESHTEFASYKTPNQGRIPRTVYGKITWRF